MGSPYRRHILDHYRHPRNQGILEDADVSATLDNPVCGDVVRLDLRLQSGMVDDVRFSGHGCVISMASASMLTEVVQGKTVESLAGLSDDDVFEMLGVSLGLVRSKCALLPLRVLQAGLKKLAGD